MNDYYVYEHIRLDNNTCFYVGKGRGKRAFQKKRNAHHDRIVNKYGMEVKIIADNLSEEEAYDIESKTISYYVFILGYGIDILGYNNYDDRPGYLTNSTFGGDGSKGMVHSEEWCLNHSLDMIGENNPAYGKNYWETYSEEKSKEIKDKLSIRFSGKNNPMYGISPKDRMSDETYKKWKEKRDKRLSNQIGDKNPNYGNKTLHNKVKDNPELRIQYYSRPGSQNGRARGVKVFNTDRCLINDFDCIKDCCIWLKETFDIKTTIDALRSGIIQSIKKERIYKNFYFEFK